jgi:iron complex transport system substrate-binding protein
VKTGIADLIFHDLGLLPTPGTPEPELWGGKVTSLKALSSLNPDHVILLVDNNQNVLEHSNIWSSIQAVKSGKVYRMTSRQNYNKAFLP